MKDKNKGKSKKKTKNNDYIIPASIILGIIIIIVIIIINNKPSNDTTEEQTKTNSINFYAHEIYSNVEDAFVKTYEEYKELVSDYDENSKSFFKGRNVYLHQIDIESCGEDIYDLLSESAKGCSDPKIIFYVKNPCCSKPEKKSYLVMNVINEKVNIEDLETDIKYLYNSCKGE